MAEKDRPPIVAQDRPDLAARDVDFLVEFQGKP